MTAESILPTEKHEEFDSNLFNTNNNKCNKTDGNKVNNVINNCECLKRLSYALKYYSDKAKVEKEWIRFCINIYSHQMLDDYSHLLSAHYQQIEQIKNELTSSYGFIQF
eukprot:504729_1